jgi:hypothetical protein
MAGEEDSMKSPKPIKRAVSPDETRRLWARRKGVDSFLRQMREQGALQVESILALCELGSMSLAEAKKTVHFSPAWADMRKSHDALHDAAFDALEKWANDGQRERIAS